jgi:hypothetical protein
MKHMEMVKSRRDVEEMEDCGSVKTFVEQKYEQKLRNSAPWPDGSFYRASTADTGETDRRLT